MRSHLKNTLHNLSLHLGVGFRQRTRRIYGVLQQRLYLDFWFPHVPLALASMIFGLLDISPDIARRLGISMAGKILPEHVVAQTILQGVPETVMGGMLVVMAVGMLLRSKLAWAITLVILVASLLLGTLGHTSISSVMLAANVLLLVTLLLGYRSFQRSSLAAGTLFAITSIVTVLVYAVFGSYQLGAGFAPPITSLATALYFSIETMSTVGYGDITPKTADARLFVISVIVLGISVFAASLSAVLVPIINRRITQLLRPGEGKMGRSDHYVIVGDTPLAHNTYKALKARHQNITMVFPRDYGNSKEAGMDIVVGDPSNLDILREAGAHRAKAVLSLRDNDSENAFVVLAMRELAENVKTVVAVHNARNLASVKRVHPDLIISPQILGGELLAMALSGEEVNTENLLDQLLLYHS